MSFIELKNVCKQYANTNKKAVTDFYGVSELCTVSAYDSRKKHKLWT